MQRPSKVEGGQGTGDVDRFDKSGPVHALSLRMRASILLSAIERWTSHGKEGNHPYAFCLAVISFIGGLACT